MAELRVPEEVVAALGAEPEREALEALLLHLIRADKVSVAWAGQQLGLDRQEAIRWYTSRGYPFPDYAEEDLEEDARHAERFRG
jgi:predicted HTH domain antitoxin